MNLPNLEAIRSMVFLNLRLIAQEPGEALLRPLATNDALWSVVLVMLLSAAIYAGVARHWRREGARPLHAILPLYVLVILVHPFDPGRYLLAFSPLFFAELCLQSKHFSEAVARRLGQDCGLDERLAGWALKTGALVVLSTILVNYAYFVPRALSNVGVKHETALADEKGAYEWLRKHAAPSARIIAHEDDLTYLYTSRRSLTAIATLTEAFYIHNRRITEHDAEHLADVARHIDASYWLTTPYDYPLGKNADRVLLRATQEDLLQPAPVVYRSRDGLVVLYDTHCLWGTGACGGASIKNNKVP